MDRYAIFVDAGYFFTQASQMLSSKKSYTRSELSLTDALGLKNLLIAKAEESLGNTRLLRIYWYDGVKFKLTPMQRQIVEMDDLQLRVGTINGKGQQKGVDSLIVTDLLELATNHAITDALVITGDSDLAVGISIAQKKGVRIAVMGLHDDVIGVGHSQSFEITSIADKLIRINCATISPYISYTPPAPAPAPAPSATVATPPTSGKPKVAKKVTAAAAVPVAPTTPVVADVAPTLTQAIAKFVSDTPSLSKTMLQGASTIESGVDRKFLYELCKTMKLTQLTAAQKIEAREALRTILRGM